jgi:hypothetical protein
VILKGDKMGDFGVVVLIIFIAIRVLIALGIVYLIFYEVRRLRKPKVRGEDKETKRDANAKDADSSSGNGG